MRQPFELWARFSLFRARFLRFALVGVLLTLIACKTSDVTNSLQLVIVAAEAAVGALQAGGSLSASTAAELNGYLQAVSKAISYAASELASTDSSGVKANKIAGQFAAIAAPNLPAGTPQTVVAVIQAVTSAVGNFLATIKPAPSTLTARAAPLPEIKLTRGDHAALAKIKSRADALAARK